MTSDRTEYQRANLEFFKDFVLFPARDETELKLLSEAETPILKSRGLIEAFLWMQLGVKARFLDTESVSRFLTGWEGPLSNAWGHLIERNARPRDGWCAFMSDEPQPRFMEDKFFDVGQPEIETLEDLSSEQYDHLSQWFLGCLLLTSEVIWEPRTMVFLEKIRWASDEEWNSLIRGYSEPTGFRMQDLYIGLANHLRYSEHLLQHINFYLNEDISRRREIELPYVYPYPYFRAQVIHSERLIVGQPTATNRFLQLVAEILGMLNQPGPEWQHVRLAILEEVSQITRLDKGEISRWWSDIERVLDTGRRQQHFPFEAYPFATE